MRLPMLEEGQSALQRLIFGVIRTIVGDLPGPIALMSYRSSLFGLHFSRILQQSMRRQLSWSIAEVELFSAWVAKQSGCEY